MAKVSITSFFKGFFRSIRSFFGSFFSGFYSTVRSFFRAIGGFFQSIFSFFKDQDSDSLRATYSSDPAPGLASTPASDPAPGLASKIKKIRTSGRGNNCLYYSYLQARYGHQNAEQAAVLRDLVIAFEREYYDDDSDNQVRIEQLVRGGMSEDSEIRALAALTGSNIYVYVKNAVREYQWQVFSSKLEENAHITRGRSFNVGTNPPLFIHLEGLHYSALQLPEDVTPENFEAQLRARIGLQPIQAVVQPAAVVEPEAVVEPAAVQPEAVVQPGAVVEPEQWRITSRP